MSVRPSLLSCVKRLCLILMLVSVSTVLGWSQDSELRHRAVPEDCTVYLNWASLSGLKKSGSPSEDWMGQPDVQLMFKKLFRAIEEYQRDNSMRDEVLNELAIKIPTFLKDCPATIVYGGLDAEKEVGESGYLSAVVELKQHEEYVAKTLEKMVAANKEKSEIESIEVDGVSLYKMSISPQLYSFYGIHKGNFIAVIGVESVDSFLANLKTPAPAWVGEVAKTTEVKRPFVEFRIDPKMLHKQIKNLPSADQVPEFLELEEFEMIVGGFGLDDEGFIASAMIQCPQELKGILSALDGKPIQESSISDMPNDSVSSAAARLPVQNILKLFKESIKVSGAEDGYADWSLLIEDLTGLNLEEEIVGSFEGTIYSFSKVTGTNVISLKLADPEKFADQMKVFAESIAVEAEAVEGGELTTKEYKDYVVYSFTQPAYLGPSVSWCHVEDELYLSLESRGITSQIRRRGKTRSRLVDEIRFKKMYEFGESKGWGKPMFVSHIDMETVIQLAIPLAQTALGSQTIPGFDFSFEDVPSVEILTKNLKANVICFYRTKNGIRMIERSTIPGASSVGLSGVAIGMLLPAVQQVRAAARRATTMNNMRQLQLAVLNYESANRRMPAAYSVDKDGKPLLSWRVHVLPYLGENALYEKFRLNEPWDSPHNKALIAEMPETFVNPQANPAKGKTTFLGSTGAGGAFSSPKGRQIAEIIDGTANSISIVDVGENHATDWTAPNDLDPSEVDDVQEMIQSTWGSRALVVLVDGSAHTLEGVTDEQIRELMNIKDGKGKISDY